MLEQRQAVCLHCGHVNTKPDKVLYEGAQFGFGDHTEMRHEYTCEVCHKQYEYYWMWEGDECVLEETVKIEWRNNPYFKPDSFSDSKIAHEPFYEFREVNRVDLRFNKKGE